MDITEVTRKAKDKLPYLSETNNELTTSAHKTEGLNRAQKVRFNPFTFTGKERDEETGYGYFGARYMDYELMTLVSLN